MFSGGGVAGYKECALPDNENGQLEAAMYDLPWDCCMDGNGDLIVVVFFFVWLLI